MTEALGSWDEVVAFALRLPGSELSTSYGLPAVKAEGRAFLYRGREPETSFALAINKDRIALLMETDPDTYWQTPHYQGWPALLIRFDSADPERVKQVIRDAHAQALAKPKPRPRKR